MKSVLLPPVPRTVKARKARCTLQDGPFSKSQPLFGSRRPCFSPHMPSSSWVGRLSFGLRHVESVSRSARSEWPIVMDQEAPTHDGWPMLPRPRMSPTIGDAATWASTVMRWRLLRSSMTIGHSDRALRDIRLLVDIRARC